METNLQEKFQFGKVKIDSLRILIPTEEVQNNSPVNRPTKLVDSETGEFYSQEFKKNAIAFEHNGCMIRIAMTSQARGETQLTAFAISLTAKMTKNYFEGITKENLIQCYEYTQSMKEGLKFSIDSFERAMIADIDYAIDFQMKPEELNEVGNIVRRITKPELIGYLNQFKQKNNTGFEFNKREKATPGKPFVKIYHKTLEIINKGEAWSKELKNLPQIARLETTMKNSKFWKAANIEQPKTLKELIELNSNEIYNYTMGAIDRNYTGRLDKLKPMKKAGERNTKEIIAEELIRHVLETDPTYGTAVLKQILERMKEAGYNRSTLMRARDFINASRPEASKPEPINFEKDSNIEVMLKALNLVR